MKHAKKLTALFIVLTLLLSLSATAFAAADYSITVNNAKAGETYSAYKMLDLSVDDPETPTAYRYTVNSAWSGFKNDSAFTAAFAVDEQGYVTAKSGVEDETNWTADGTMSKLAEAAAKYAKDNSIAVATSGTVAADKTSVTLELTEAGYYVVSSTLGTRAMIATTPANSAVTVNEKNTEDQIAKTVKEDSAATYGAENSAQIGDTVEFKSVVTIVPRSVNVKIHDTMDAGLTLNAGSIKIYADEKLQTELASDQYEIQETPDKDDTFTIQIKDTFAATATADQILYVTYTAELNKNVIAAAPAVVNQTNTTYVSFGAGSKSTTSTTTTKTYSVTIYKHATGETDNLADAIFQLKKDGTVVNLMKIDATNYRVVDNTETTAAVSHVNNGEVNTITNNTIVSDFVTVSTGDIVIWGLDLDSDYTITELQAPKGYNKLADSAPLTVNEGAFVEADVVNQTGAELPSTGGIGTTIFYVLGGLLAAGALVLLITNKRMKPEN